MAFSYAYCNYICMLHDEEQRYLYSYRAFVAALDRRTRPPIMPDFLAKLAATEALKSSKLVFPSYKQVYRMCLTALSILRVLLGSFQFNTRMCIMYTCRKANITQQPNQLSTLSLQYFVAD